MGDEDSAVGSKTDQSRGVGTAPVADATRRIKPMRNAAIFRVSSTAPGIDMRKILDGRCAPRRPRECSTNRWLTKVAIPPRERRVLPGSERSEGVDRLIRLRRVD